MNMINSRITGSNPEFSSDFRAIGGARAIAVI